MRYSVFAVFIALLAFALATEETTELPELISTVDHGPLMHTLLASGNSEKNEGHDSVRVKRTHKYKKYGGGGGCGGGCGGNYYIPRQPTCCGGGGGGGSYSQSYSSSSSGSWGGKK